MTNSRHWIEYTADWRDAPMAYWVHVQQDHDAWYSAQQFRPAAPNAVPHKGYAVTCVEFQGTVLRFSSPEQLVECIRVLSHTPLPTTRRLSANRDGGAGPNSHWLSRLPASLKAPKARAQLVAGLEEAARANGALDANIVASALRRSSTS